MFLLIACGNTLRQDDGAGVVLVEKLAEIVAAKTAVSTIVVHQLVPELSAEIAEEAVEAVLFVDTRVATTGDTQQVEIERLPDTAVSSPIGHHLTPTVLLVYARELYGRRPPAWLVTVPGVAFGHGEALSDVAQNAIAQLQPQLIHTALRPLYTNA